MRKTGLELTIGGVLVHVKASRLRRQRYGRLNTVVIRSEIMPKTHASPRRHGLAPQMVTILLFALCVVASPASSQSSPKADGYRWVRPADAG